MLGILSILFITAIICSIIAIPFTFDPPTKDIKGYPGFLVKMYCVIPIFFAGLYWSKTTAIISVIMLIGYAYSHNDKPDKEKASNENTS